MRNPRVRKEPVSAGVLILTVQHEQLREAALHSELAELDGVLHRQDERLADIVLRSCDDVVFFEEKVVGCENENQGKDNRCIKAFNVFVHCRRFPKKFYCPHEYSSICRQCKFLSFFAGGVFGGTGSYPEPPQGWQRKSLLLPSQRPLITP